MDSGAFRMSWGMPMKKRCCLPPGKADELITRIEQLEARLTAVEAAARAFAVVFAIPRIPDPVGEGGSHAETSPEARR